MDRRGVLVAHDEPPGGQGVVARTSRWFDVQFPPRERHALAVGATVFLWREAAIGGRTQEVRAIVVARSEGRAGRCYRFRLQQQFDADAVPPLAAPVSSPMTSIGAAIARAPSEGRERAARTFAPKVGELHFGHLEFPTRVVAFVAQGLRLEVTLPVERQLRAADALELLLAPRAASPGVRLTGWVVRRVLDGARVAYDYRIDERLTDDCPRQVACLEELLSGRARHPSP